MAHEGTPACNNTKQICTPTQDGFQLQPTLIPTDLHRGHRERQHIGNVVIDQCGHGHQLSIKVNRTHQTQIKLECRERPYKPAYVWLWQITPALKGNYHQKIRVANTIDLLLKGFFGVSLAYIQSLEGSQKVGRSVA